MKQIALLLSFFFIVAPAFSQTPAPGTPMIGDVNVDSKVDIVDALLVAKYYVGACDCVADPAVADVNLDGKADIVDALVIAQYYVGLVSSLPINQKQLENTTWILQSFSDRNNPVPLLTGAQITLLLKSNEKTATGSAGCNTYTATYGIDGSLMGFGNFRSTMMNCMDPPGVMQLENQFVGALSGAETYALIQNRLTIYCSSDRILVFN